jgi:hypothetical protein
MRAGLIAGFVTIILFTTGVVVAETSMSEQNVLKGRETFTTATKARRSASNRQIDLNVGRERKEV